MHLVVKFDVPDAKFSYFRFLVARVVHFVVVVDVFRSRGLVVEAVVLSSHVAKMKVIKWRDALDCARSSARPPFGASVLARLPQHEAEFLQADRPSKRYYRGRKVLHAWAYPQLYLLILEMGRTDQDRGPC